MLAAALVDRVAQIVPLGDSISIDGGLSQSPYFAQFQATACNRTIIVPPMHELTALGLAELCGVDVAAARSGAAVFQPDGSIRDADRTRFDQALQRARAWRS